MSSLQELINRAFEPVQAALYNGSIPGAVLGLVTQDGDRVVRYAGRAQVVPEDVAMVEEDDLRSCLADQGDFYHDPDSGSCGE